MAPGEIERLKDCSLEMLEKTRAETGCISYSFARALDDPNTMMIQECWEDAEALDAHMKSAHMAGFNKAISQADILGADIKRYDSEKESVLMGG